MECRATGDSTAPQQKNQPTQQHTLNPATKFEVEGLEHIYIPHKQVNKLPKLHVFGCLRSANTSTDCIGRSRSRAQNFGNEQRA